MGDPVVHPRPPKWGSTHQQKLGKGAWTEQREGKDRRKDGQREGWKAEMEVRR